MARTSESKKRLDGGMTEESAREVEATEPFELKFKINKEDADSIYGYLARSAPDGFPKIDFIPNKEDGTVTMILVAKMDGRKSLAKGLRFIYNLVLRIGVDSKDASSQLPKKKANNDQPPRFDTGERKQAKPSKIAA